MYYLISHLWKQLNVYTGFQIGLEIPPPPPSASNEFASAPTPHSPAYKSFTKNNKQREERRGGGCNVKRTFRPTC